MKFLFGCWNKIQWSNLASTVTKLIDNENKLYLWAATPLASLPTDKGGGKVVAKSRFMALSADAVEDEAPVTL